MEKYDVIIANGGLVCYNSIASRFSHFKTGGRIELLLQPTTKESFVETLRILSDEPYKIIGATTNTLINDNGVKGVVVSTVKLKGYEIGRDWLYSYAGERVANLAVVAKRNKLSGLEELCNIPGTIGGAVTMNASCYGKAIIDLIEYVEVYRDEKLVKLFPDELNMTYRDSIIRQGGIIVVGVKLKLKRCNMQEISDKMKEITAKRKRMQPIELSLGSVFKNPSKDLFAGELIESAGLKSLCIGGARVSDKHANIIVNAGSATSGDYMDLVNTIIEKVKQNSGIELEREIIYL